MIVMSDTRLVTQSSVLRRNMKEMTDIITVLVVVRFRLVIHSHLACSPVHQCDTHESRYMQIGKKITNMPEEKYLRH